MTKTVADQFAETLAAVGVKRIYGIVGDSLNGLTDSIRRQGKIEWIHVRHEEVAAFAAGAEAHLTDELAVCAGSCGPGNLHLINGLFDCHRSRVPVLGIAAQIPSAEIGSGYFRSTPLASRRSYPVRCRLPSPRSPLARTSLSSPGPLLLGGICAGLARAPAAAGGAYTGPPPAPRRAFLALSRRGRGPRARCRSGHPRGAAPTGAPDRRCLSGPGASCTVRAARAPGHRAARRPN